MADSVSSPTISSLADALGFRHLFRAFKLAFDHRKIALAVAAILVIYLAGRGLDGLWPASAKTLVAADGLTELDQFRTTGFNRARTVAWIEIVSKQSEAKRVGLFATFLHQFRVAAKDLTEAALALNPHAVLRVLVGVVAVFVWMLVIHPVFGVLFLAVWLGAWGYFGGAIARIAALDVTRGDKIELGEALGFARRKFLNFLTAPLGPILGLIGCAVLLTLGGLVGAIPAVGTLLVPLFWIIAVIIGFVMALLIVGFALGWPLMYPTIAVEGADAFDAISRSYAYVANRIWRTVWYYGVSLVYGSICFLFVKLLARLALFFAHFGVGLSMNAGDASGASGNIPDKLNAMWSAPLLDFSNPFYGDFPRLSLTGVSWVGSLLISVWVYLVFAVVAGFLVSFFQSASSIIYVLLRRDEDATDLEEVYLDDDDMADPSGTTPLAAEPTTSPSSSTPGSLASLPVVGTNPSPRPSEQ